MIQDIGQGVYHNEYRPVPPSPESRVLSYRGRELLLRREGSHISFLTYEEAASKVPEMSECWIYLFAMEDTSYYLLPELPAEAFEGASWEGIQTLRSAVPRVEAFAGVTGLQLHGWYRSRRFCPACGRPMVHAAKERMMHCTVCGQIEYPKICPAVIVGIVNGDRLLLTKYADRDFKRYALVAGYAEVGETIEETVHREVMEETGLKVKNLHYYKSQPWSFSDTLLFGFFAELDGDPEVHLDDHELALARWCTRDEIPEDDGISLTREMMRVFKNYRPASERADCDGEIR